MKRILWNFWQKSCSRRRVGRRTSRSYQVESLEGRRVLTALVGEVGLVGDVELVVGDANSDGQFDEADFIQVFQAGKYETGQAADWTEGDWNQDGYFDSDDMVKVMQDGNYAPAAASEAEHTVDADVETPLDNPSADGNDQAGDEGDDGERFGHRVAHRLAHRLHARLSHLKEAFAEGDLPDALAERLTPEKLESLKEAIDGGDRDAILAILKSLKPEREAGEEGKDGERMQERTERRIDRLEAAITDGTLLKGLDVETANSIVAALKAGDLEASRQLFKESRPERERPERSEVIAAVIEKRIAAINEGIANGRIDADQGAALIAALETKDLRTYREQVREIRKRRREEAPKDGEAGEHAQDRREHRASVRRRVHR